MLVRSVTIYSDFSSDNRCGGRVRKHEPLPIAHEWNFHARDFKIRSYYPTSRTHTWHGGQKGGRTTPALAPFYIAMTIQKTEVVGATHGIRVTNEGVAQDWMEIHRGEKAGEEDSKR